MIAQEEIDRLKAKGELVITSQTFKKSILSSGQSTMINSGQGPIEFNASVVYYKGLPYRHEWLLTYGMREYQHLIRVFPEELEAYQLWHVKMDRYQALSQEDRNRADSIAKAAGELAKAQGLDYWACVQACNTARDAFMQEVRA